MGALLVPADEPGWSTAQQPGHQTSHSHTGNRGDQVPHALHVRVALPSEELVVPVCPDHVFVHGELHIAPEGSVLLGGHGEPAGQTVPPEVGSGGGCTGGPREGGHCTLREAETCALLSANLRC